jgi:hypothetical protein
MVIDIWRRGPISFEHVSLRCLLFDPHWTTYQMNLKGPIKKNKPLKTHHLKAYDFKIRNIQVNITR